MADRKITVVGDGAEKPLTPEEEHKIEVKIDKMLAVGPSDATTADDAKLAEPVEDVEAILPKITKIITKFADDTEDEKPEVASVDSKTEAADTSHDVEVAPEAAEPATEPHSAPPLPKKASKKPAKKIAVKEHVEEPVAEPAVAESAPAKKPKSKKIITKFADDEPGTEPKADEPEKADANPDFDAIQAAALAAEAHMKGSRASKAEADKPAPETEEPSEPAPDEAAGAEEIENPDTPLTEPETEAVAEPVSAGDSETEEAEPAPESEPEPAPKVRRTITKFADDTPAELPEEAAADTEPVPGPPAVETDALEAVEPTQAAPPPAKPDPLPGLRPIAIPRAKPLPTEEIVDNITSANSEDPLSAEDAAIARAFEEKQPGVGERVGPVVAAVFSVRTLRVLMVLALIGLVGASAVMPKIRTRVIDFTHSTYSKFVRKAPATSSTGPKSSSAGGSATQTTVTAKELYVAKQAGTYNLYKADTDGQNPELLLAGTGNEDVATTVLAPNALGDTAALVSTRTKSTGDGAAQESLTIIDVATGKTDTVDQADQVRIVDWFGSKLSYVLIKATASTTDVTRYQLVSYDTKTKQHIPLDHGNYFNDVLSAQGAIYYAISAKTGGTAQFAKVMPDGSLKQILLPTEIWRIYRSGYDTLALATATSWYNYTIGDAKPQTTSKTYNAPSRLYIDNPSGTQSVWVDTSGAKPSLKLYDKTTRKDTVLTDQAGLSYPVRWLDSKTLVYRLKTSSDAADYVITVNDTTPKKLADVANTSGISQWYGN